MQLHNAQVNASAGASVGAQTHQRQPVGVGLSQHLHPEGLLVQGRRGEQRIANAARKPLRHVADRPRYLRNRARAVRLSLRGAVAQRHNGHELVLLGERLANGSALGGTGNPAAVEAQPLCLKHDLLGKVACTHVEVVALMASHDQVVVGIGEASATGERAREHLRVVVGQTQVERAVGVRCGNGLLQRRALLRRDGLLGVAPHGMPRLNGLVDAHAVVHLVTLSVVICTPHGSVPAGFRSRRRSFRRQRQPPVIATDAPELRTVVIQVCVLLGFCRRPTQPCVIPGTGSGEKKEICGEDAPRNALPRSAPCLQTQISIVCNLFFSPALAAGKANVPRLDADKELLRQQ